MQDAPSHTSAAAYLLFIACLFSTHTSIADEPLIDQLNELIEASFIADRPGGAVIVRKAGHTLVHEAYGMADLELAVPMSTEHRLAVGSITKTFTAAGILSLVEKGKLSLEDDVREILPSLSPGDERITVRQLLNHTSGFPSVLDREDFDILARQYHTVDDLLSLTEGMSLHFSPGAGFRYSDSGYFALGAIIEKISGLTYAEFLKTHVFEPNGLRNTEYGDDKEIIRFRASGYTSEADRLLNATYIDMSVPYAAGAVYSTVEDLANWVDVFRAGRLIGPGLRNEAWTSATLPDGTATGYGLGWEVCEIAGERVFGHGGFIYGFTANLEYFPDAKITIAVMTNQDVGDPEASYLVRRIARLLLTGSAEIQVVELGDSERASFAGVYQYENGDQRQIFERDGGLWSQRNDRAPVRLVPLSSSFLAFPDTEGTYGLEFFRGAGGQPKKVVSRLNCSPTEVAMRR